MANYIEEMRVALRPFAELANEYDERVYPPDKDSQRISVTLGECRRAAEALKHIDELNLSNSDIINRLIDLHRQATEEKSHFYVASCVKDAILEINCLRNKNND